MVFATREEMSEAKVSIVDKGRLCLSVVFRMNKAAARLASLVSGSCKWASARTDPFTKNNIEISRYYCITSLPTVIYSLCVYTCCARVSLCHCILAVSLQPSTHIFTSMNSLTFHSLGRLFIRHWPWYFRICVVRSFHDVVIVSI